MPVQSKFKSYQIVTGNSPHALQMQLEPLISQGGWQLYGPPMMTPYDDGVLFAQGMLLFEIVQTESEVKQ